jgi:hypothetical protein
VKLSHFGAFQGAAQALQTDPGSRFDLQAIMVLALAAHDEIKACGGMVCILVGPCGKQRACRVIHGNSRTESHAA